MAAKTHSVNASVLTLACLLSAGASAFDSGSTGADGPFSPLVDTQLALPPDGVFNFTQVNIPAGVTVTFQRNSANTPVTLLASGSVTIAGAIEVSGAGATDVGAAGDGNVGDDGLPGSGGPGGFDGGAGGAGGVGVEERGGDGLGPGGGLAGVWTLNIGPCGGGYYTAGGNARDPRCVDADRGNGGAAYGSQALLPLIGGSGGGGAAGAWNFHGSGGGGGGGALLIAASGSIDVSGAIRADGGHSGYSQGLGAGGSGGGGSGGAIRLVATTLRGNGAIEALQGRRADAGWSAVYGGDGAVGRIRLEAETITRGAATNPAYTFGSPGDVFVAGLPRLRIGRVAGVDAPAAPTGNADIVLPEDTPNPVTVAFEASNVPPGNTVRLRVIPAHAAAITTLSDALAGTEANSTASATIELPSGPSVLQATLSYTVTAAVGDRMRHFAHGERVARVLLAAVPGGTSQTVFIGVSGRRYAWPGPVAGMN